MMKNDKHSVRAIQNIKNRRKKYLYNIEGDELQLEKLNRLDRREQEDRLFRDKYSYKRG